MQDFCDASLARAAIQTSRDWHSQFDWLVSEAYELLSLQEVHEGRLSQRWWDFQPFVYLCILLILESTTSCRSDGFVPIYATRPKMVATITMTLEKKPYKHSL